MSIEQMVKWFLDREGKVTYSMTYRLGLSSYNCSSAVFLAMIAGRFLPVDQWEILKHYLVWWALNLRTSVVRKSSVEIFLLLVLQVSQMVQEVTQIISLAIPALSTVRIIGTESILIATIHT